MLFVFPKIAEFLLLILESEPITIEFANFEFKSFWFLDITWSLISTLEFLPITIEFAPAVVVSVPSAIESSPKARAPTFTFISLLSFSIVFF